MIILPDAENRRIVSSFVCTKHRNVTDGQTDRQTGAQICHGYYSGLYCDECGRTVKTKVSIVIADNMQTTWIKGVDR